MSTSTSAQAQSGLALSHPVAYLPAHAHPPVEVLVSGRFAPGILPDLTYRLNGQEGRHPGIAIESSGPQQWKISFSPAFRASYQGSWPATMEVLAQVDAGLSPACTLALHDGAYPTGTQPGNIGLRLRPNRLYPPYRREVDVVMIDKDSAADVSLDLSLNDVEGPVPGVTLRAAPRVAMLFIEQEFLQKYAGNWPACMTIRALWHDGSLADAADLNLFDTRTVLAYRATTKLSPRSLHVPPAGSGAREVVYVLPEFHDIFDIKIPLEELDWSVELRDSPVGIWVEDHRIVVSEDAQPGSYYVKVEDANGTVAHVMLQLHTPV